MTGLQVPGSGLWTLGKGSLPQPETPAFLTVFIVRALGGCTFLSIGEVKHLWGKAKRLCSWELSVIPSVSFSMGLSLKKKGMINSLSARTFSYRPSASAVAGVREDANACAPPHPLPPAPGCSPWGERSGCFCSTGRLSLCLGSMGAETRLVWRFAYSPAGLWVRQRECPAPAQLLTPAALAPLPDPHPQASVFSRGNSDGGTLTCSGWWHGSRGEADAGEMQRRAMFGPFAEAGNVLASDVLKELTVKTASGEGRLF